uniref:Uncharacterized protein n=1 Tax=Knipowitschia caucasica TaxID=637954 RepID=A0AAV2KVH6_KNICA
MWLVCVPAAAAGSLSTSQPVQSSVSTQDFGSLRSTTFHFELEKERGDRLRKKERGGELRKEKERGDELRKEKERRPAEEEGEERGDELRKEERGDQLRKEKERGEETS